MINSARIFLKTPKFQIFPSSSFPSLPPQSPVSSSSPLTSPPTRFFASSTSRKKNISFIRIFLLILIAITGIMTGCILYQLISQSRQRLQHTTYNNMIESNYREIKKSLFNKVQVNSHIAYNAGLLCPYNTSWPHCYLPLKIFSDRTSSLLLVSGFNHFTISPIVLSKDRKNLEKLAQESYAQDGYPPGTGSLGIFTFNGTQTPTPIPWNSTIHEMTVPILEISSDPSGGMFLLLDLYSEPESRLVIDSILECASEKNWSISECTTFSNLISVPIFDAMGGFIVSPISAYYDETRTIVGFSGAQFTWRDVLESTVIQSDNYHCVIESSSSEKVEFVVQNGRVTEGGHRHGHSKQRFVINDKFFKSHVKYTITYSPLDDDSLDLLPLIALLCCIGMTAFITGMFILYNVFVKQEVNETETLLNSKRVFVRFISHEIRTPLNTVILGLRLLEHHISTLKESSITQNKCFDECDELIRDIHENTVVAVSTLNDLINYDKIETNTFTIERKSVKIWSIIDKTTKMLDVQAREKEVTLSLQNTNTSHENIIVNGDSIKLGQVVRNLVSNALKFTPKGGLVSISVQFLPEHGEGALSLQCPYPEDGMPIGNATPGNLSITVTDSGPGLSEAQLQLMFCEGVQFNPNELQAGQGSGLGLWISKEIVSRHEGKISVTSDGIGLGSTFTVTLPAFMLDDSSPTLGSTKQNQVEDLTLSRIICPPPTSHPYTSTNVPHVNGNERHVLVVDDANSNRKLVCRILQREGYICHEAENGQVCIDKVMNQQHSYEFIVMDYEMPVLDGPSAARQLRQMKCDLLIIGLSGNVLPEDQEYFIAQGANFVLPKPLIIKDLMDRIQEYRGQSSI